MNNPDANLLHQVIMNLDDVDAHHERISYTFLDILGHVGGLSKAFSLLFGVIFTLYSENAMIMELAT